jgi:hypothetical protein
MSVVVADFVEWTHGWTWTLMVVSLSVSGGSARFDLQIGMALRCTLQ